MSNRENLIDTISRQTGFTTFARLMKSSRANDLLTALGDFTVFAPTNDAFSKISDIEMSGLLAEVGQAGLRTLLSYHIVPGKIFAASVAGKGIAKSLSGQEINFSDSNGIKVNGSKMLARNIEATNGILHGIDTVLTPPAVTESAAVTGPLDVIAAEGGSASPGGAMVAPEPVAASVTPPISSDTKTTLL